MAGPKIVLAVRSAFSNLGPKPGTHTSHQPSWPSSSTSILPAHPIRFPGPDQQKIRSTGPPRWRQNTSVSFARLRPPGSIDLLEPRSPELGHLRGPFPAHPFCSSALSLSLPTPVSFHSHQLWKKISYLSLPFLSPNLQPAPAQPLCLPLPSLDISPSIRYNGLHPCFRLSPGQHHGPVDHQGRPSGHADAARCSQAHLHW